MIVGLASLASIKSFAEALVAKNVPLRCMVLSAGLNSDERSVTVDGLEKASGANWIGHFHICHLLFNRMKDAAVDGAHAVRVVHVPGAAHTSVSVPGLHPEPTEEWLADWQCENRTHWSLAACAQSKFFQVAGANEMTRRWKQHGIASHPLHPGSVQTSACCENESLLASMTFNAPPFSFFCQERRTRRSHASFRCHFA
jgi:NAD(P)-dependent dehydrogenase (short-subunit alcohol dehydrogenase family)